ncbi:hypothetical protein [Hymenobacter metallicola]|nr:hypothetical protein [Hymenobacter metallicola]
MIQRIAVSKGINHKRNEALLRQLNLPKVQLATTKVVAPFYYRQELVRQ